MVRAERAEAEHARQLAAADATARTEERAAAAAAILSAQADAREARAAAAANNAAADGAAAAASAAAAAAARAVRPRADASAQAVPCVADAGVTVDTLTSVLEDTTADLAEARSRMRDLKTAYDANEVLLQSMRAQLADRDSRVRCAQLA